MPYSNVSELPPSVKDNLPAGAQRIFLGAFNSAMADGKSEQQAFQIAWAAVKEKYVQVQGKWVRKPS